MATILDVAREAGVGVGTVSRVLNNSPQVSPRTRERVEEAIARLGYSPNPLARSLSTGRTDAITILVPYFTTPSVVERLRGIVSVLDDADRAIVLRNVESIEQLDRAVADLTGPVLPTGLVVISLPVDGLATVDLPVVAVDTTVDGCVSIDIDDEAAGRSGAEYLLAAGHRRIAFVGDAEDHPLGFRSSAQRRRGYERALEAAGVAIRPGFVKQGSPDRATAHRLTAELLDSSEQPTAIFAASDTQALGVIEAARARGLDVPGDLSVLGFDDVEVAAYVGLTTVRQPLFESGRLGAERLLTAVGGGVGESVTLPTSIVERTTVAPPEAGRA